MQSNKTMVRDLTQGNVASLLIRFAFPLFVSNALQAVYNLVDMVVVGQHLGSPGMSAVSTGGDVLHLLTFLAMGLSSAGQVIIAQEVGARRMDRVSKTIGTLFTFMLGTALFMSLTCVLLRTQIVDWLHAPAESRELTLDYMLTCALGLVFIYGYNIVSAILRGMGDSKRPFVFVAIAAVLNIVLDLLFVLVWDMKAFGAALATVIGQGVSFVTALVYLYRRREMFGFDFKPASFRPDPYALRRLIALGVPMAIQSAAISMSKIVLTSWINGTGLVNSALNGIFNKVALMCSVVSNAFTAAGSSMVGQNLGARKPERVPLILRTILVCGMSVSVLFGVAVVFFHREIFGMFTSDEAALTASAILVVPTLINFFGAATRSIAFALINGSGNTKLNLAVALIDGLCSRIGFAALLGFALGMDCLGFWLGDALAGCVPMLIGGWYLLSGRWRNAVPNR